ncbi:MAG: hypothetical protein A3I78_00435 [Gammaproteobacteria bacterium RIFCSPLOWO2_02_FULL_56_15]|nr:MAG: hypothetical protein A3I78_00435 [Gammaproteobacteria bacterium RIFCSPLOWO2_02_FULL_56_15]
MNSGRLMALLALVSMSLQVLGQDPEWDKLDNRACDRTCLITHIDNYTKAILAHDYSGLPFALAVRFTENTAQLDVGEGFLWRAELQETTFKYQVADPMVGQVANGMVLNIDGRPALVAVRLRIERGQIMEIEHMVDRNVAPEAMELLQTPVAYLSSDVSASERTPREVMIAAANAYFAALTGDNGKIAPFHEDCVRHENGYQTVNNDKPGRAAPSPALPNPETPMGRTFMKMSTMTCEEQVSTKIFSGIKKIWPRRVLIVDEQKGVVAAFPLFIHDGTRRTNETEGLPDMPNQSRLAMMLNMVTMESFAIRSGKIMHVEAFPFITFPYGLGDGWTVGSGR